MLVHFLHSKRLVLATLLFISSLAGVSPAQGYYNADGQFLRERQSTSTGAERSIEFSETSHRGQVPSTAIEYSVVWDSIKEWSSPIIGRGLAVSGRLDWKSVQGGSGGNVNWLQGLRVLVSKYPSINVDWTDGHHPSNTAWSDVVIRPDGQFLAFMPFDYIHRSVGHSDVFQVGASLAKRTGTTLQWNSASPAIEGSVKLLEVPGAKQLSVTQEKINGVSGPWVSGYDPTALIEAVSYLRNLGKSEVIEALEEYLSESAFKSQRGGAWPRNPKSSDHADADAVFLIVRLLFEPDSPAEAMPKLAIGAPSPPPPTGIDCSLFPLVIEGGIPFLLVNGYSLGGDPQHPRAHLDWARRHGRLRETELVPSDDPWAAGERLRNKLPAEHRYEYDYIIRLQVLRCVWNVIPDEMRVRNPLEDDRWLQWTSNLSAAGQIVFDHQQMHFVLAPQ